MSQNPQPIDLTIVKNGKEQQIKFKQFGKINFGEGVKTVDELTKQERKKIESMYKKIAANVKKKIELLEQQKNGTATDALQKLQLEDLKNSIEKDLQELTQVTQNMIKENMEQSAKAVTDDMTKWLNSYGVNIKTSYAHVPQDVVANIVSGRLYGKNWNFSKRIWGDYNKSVSDITQIVARGIAENKPTFDIAKDLERYVNPSAAKPWDWSKVYPNSKKKVDYNAQRLARTMIAHAYQQSIVETSKTNPFVKGIQWVAAFTHRTCEICAALNGQIFAVDKVPLDHPNGGCTFIAVIDKSPQEIADAMLEWYNGNASEEFNAKMELFAEKAGFTKADIDINKLASLAEKTQTQIKYNDKQWLQKNCITQRMVKGLEMETEEVNAITNVLANDFVSDDYRKAFAKTVKKIKNFIVDNDSYYMRKDKELALGYDYERLGNENIYFTLFHEMGHAIDSISSSTTLASSGKAEFKQAMKEDLKNLIKAVKQDKAAKDKIENLRYDDNSVGVQDAISGARNLKHEYSILENIRVKWGHSDSYWVRSDVEREIASELFANISAASVSPKEMAYMNEYFPNATKKYNEIISKFASE